MSQLRKVALMLVIFCGLGFAALAQPALGSKAPEITLPDLTGTNISLSALKGKVVLLDFWASWCGPCRRNNRAIIPVFEKYNSKGFEIFSVSLDANTPEWMRAVQQDKMPWKQVIDTKAAYGNELTQTWNLQAIPATFLLNKEGKIVAQGVEKKELEKLLEKML